MKRKIKTLTLILLSVFFKAGAQQHLPTKWTAFTQFSIQESDKRMYGHPSTKYYTSTQPERFGTYQLNFGVKRCLYRFKKLEVGAGLGLGGEIATFDRYYTVRYFPATFYYRFESPFRSYGHILFLIPIEVRLGLVKNGGIVAGLLPQFIIINTVNANRPDKDHVWKIDPGFYSTELNAGIYYVLFKRIELTANCRLGQQKIVDKVLFNNSIYPKADFSDRYETYNLLKFTMGAGVKF